MDLDDDRLHDGSDLDWLDAAEAPDLVDEVVDDLVDDVAEPPAPPVAPGGGGPRSDHEHWLSRSPWWAIPLLVSVVIGIERLAMLAVVPGWSDLPIILFGALFVLTFTAVLIGGSLIIGAQRPR
jgi:hypothetical protein